MGSRDDQKKPHQPLLSSLVVRPSDSGGGGGSGTTDYEPGEVRPDAPPHSRSDRYSDDHHGYRTRAVSGSPTRHRDPDRRYGTDFDHPGDMRHGRGFGGGRAAVRSPVRYRDFSPPYPRGRGVGRPFPKPLDDPGFGSGRFRGEGRNNPNVRPRDGDWYCPACRNLNFARRDQCNSCSRQRNAPIRSPRRGYGGPPPPMVAPPRRFPGPPVDRFPGRFVGSYRSPPRGFLPRDIGPPPPRHESRLPPLDHHHHHPLPRDRLDPFEDEFRERAIYGRPLPPDWPARGVDRGRGMFIDRRGGYDRRGLSPPLGPHRDRWTDRDVRERSRSPFRGGPDRDRVGSVY